MPTQVDDGAAILARARSYIGKFHDGPDVSFMAMEVARAFPDMRMDAYARLANNSTAWCAIFVFYVLSQFGIRPPYDEPYDETDDWMFARSPLIAKWGTIVSRNQLRPGDIAVLSGHITFYDGDAGDGYFWGLGGNQSNAVTRARFAWSDATFVRASYDNDNATMPGPVVINATPDQITRMAKVIVDWEARRDSQGRLQVYEPPANDGGGAYEVAGINERFHPVEAANLRSLIEAGRYDEAEKAARAHIVSYTNVAAGWHRDLGVQFFNRDSAFNRGPTGAAKIFQRALKTDIHGDPLEIDGDVGPLTLGAAAAATNASDLITRLRAAREAYELDVAGYRENFWNGLVNRWNKAEAMARQFSKETPPAPIEPDPDEPEVLEPIKPPQPPANGGMLLMLLLLLISKSRESEMPTEPGAKPDIANVLIMLMLQSMMSGKPLGSDQMMAALLQSLTGKPIALTPPGTPQPDPPPATEPPKPANPQDAIMALLLQVLGGKVIDAKPVVDPTPPLQKPSVQLSGLGLVLAIGAQLLGLVGTPFGMGTTPTDTGTAAVVIPALTGLLGSTGLFGRVWNFLKNNVRLGPVA